MAKAVAVADEQSTGMERFKSQPQRLMEFLNDVRAEMRKVVSPSRPEVISTTGVVIATVFIFAAYFALTDYVFGQGITRLIQYLTKH
jgi:preprotein translocase subunit SecE